MGMVAIVPLSECTVLKNVPVVLHTVLHIRVNTNTEIHNKLDRKKKVS